MRRARVFLTILLAGVLAACTTAQSAPPYQIPTGIHKIKHVIVIQQENRSFDSYFGTYPGANGIPMNVCLTPTLPSPASGGGKNCEKPYVDHADVNGGGPHGQSNATADINGGKMDGFVAEARRAARGCLDPTNPACANGATTDVMGYHTASDIPNYWAYAKDFVLQDRMFEPNASWSLPEHLFLVSEWSAKCSVGDDECPAESGTPTGLSPGWGTANPGFSRTIADIAAGPDLCLDRPDLSAAQKPCELGLLRRLGNGARLRE